MAINTVTGGLGITATTVGSDVTVSVNQAASLAWTAKQKVLGQTPEAIPPVTAWSGDPTEFSLKVSRTAPSGVSGAPQAALVVDCTTVGGIASFEWTQLNNLENYATAQECTAFYAKANMHDTGATWAGVFEARNLQGSGATGTGPPANSQPIYAIEADICADGVDAPMNQHGVMISYGPQTGTGSASGLTAWQTNGLYIRPTVYGGVAGPPPGNGGYRCRLRNGIKTEGYMERSISAAADGINGFVSAGNLSGAAYVASGVCPQGFVAQGNHAGGAAFQSTSNAANAFQATATYSGAVVEVSSTNATYAFHCKNSQRISLSTTIDATYVLFNNTANEVQVVTGPTTKVRFAVPTVNSANYIFNVASNTAVSPSAPNGAATPVNPAGYLRIQIDGQPYKLAYYLNS